MPDWSYPKVKAQFDNDALIIKPGFCRLSLAFFMSDEEASGIYDAVKRDNLGAPACWPL